jgi:hypothetical protein
LQGAIIERGWCRAFSNTNIDNTPRSHEDQANKIPTKENITSMIPLE